MKYLVFFLLSAMSLDQQELPGLLQKALRGLPGLRLVDPSIDLGDRGYSVDELKGFGYWPPWIVRDVDRDGRPDVVAVVVKPGAKPQFGVIAVHARTASTIQWVTPLGSEPINSVTKGPGRDTVVPLHCIECDANNWYRWSGRSYEAELYAVGERIAVATYEKDHELGLFAKPTRDSKFLFPVTPCSQAVVRQVGGSNGGRWYFVEIRGRQTVRGWIPASFATEMECIG